jgi:DNA primase
VTLAPGEDPDSFLRKYGKKGFSDRMSQAKPIMDFMIEQVMGEEPPSGLEEKVALAERLAPLLSVIPNAIEQELYVKKTASLLGVEARNLMVNSPSTVAKKRKKRDDLATAGKRPKKVVPVWEGELVGLMMNNPEVIDQIKEKIEPEFFKSSELRACVERLFALPEEGLGSDSIKSLILTEDTALAGLLAKYTIEGKKPMDVQGLTDRLRLEHLKDMQRKLQAEIEVAETEGRIQKDNRLVKKKALLSQEVEALKQKLSSEGRNVTE